MWRFGPKPVFPSTPQDKTREQANADLVQALHAIANIELRKVANSAKKAANVNISNRNAQIAELQAQIAKLEPLVKAATNAAPGKPVTAQTLTTVEKASTNINKMISNIASGSYGGAKMNNRGRLVGGINNMSNENVRKNSAYQAMSANNKSKVNAAIARRRRNVAEQLIEQVKSGNFPDASRNARYAFLSQNNKNYIAQQLISKGTTN
jgi:hypothetical protein